MKLKICITIIVVAAFIGCGKTENEYSQLSIFLTDAPAAYDSVLIDVKSVEVHTNNGGWISLPTNQGIYDLLQLRNNVDTLLVPVQQIPAGKVSQVRLILGSGNRIVDGGNSYPLVIPSGEESGLKLNIHRTLQPNTSYILLLDFDAAQSVHQTGNGQYKLKPVIKANFR